MRKISMVLIGFLCFLMSSTLFFNVDIVYGWGADKSPYADPGRKWEAEEAEWIDGGWQEASDPEASEGRAMMVPGTTAANQDLRFFWVNRGREVGVDFLVRMKISDIRYTETAVTILLYLGVDVEAIDEPHRYIAQEYSTLDFLAANTYQTFRVRHEHIPENEKVVLVVRFDPEANVSLHCDFVIASPDVMIHNRIFWNALELLRRDGYEIEADVLESYMEDVQNGNCDADYGSIEHGGQYSGVPLIDTTIPWGLPYFSEEKALGGFSHYFDAWDHHGIGIAERWEEILVGTVLGLGPFITALLELIIAESGATTAFSAWKEWQGANAAQSAIRNFNRAVQAWNAGDEEKAMYFLGYTLHLLGDSCDPHHAAHTMYSGHGAVSMSEVVENLDYYLIDRPGHSSGAQQFSGDTQDHGIYLSDLYRLSDGIYIAGDPNLVDTESSTEALRYGHITQLSDPIYQFIDFAAHEAIEWYPLVNSEHEEWIDFDNWWEIWNYIETRNDLKMKTVGGEHVPFSSRLIFNFEGAGRLSLDFEGAWHNTEAIDMENWVSQDLGEVNVYNGYDMTRKAGGPYVEEGWLCGGPDLTTWPTAVVQTDVYRWGGWGDHDCDGWQLSEILVDDMIGEHDVIMDPLLNPQPQYRTTAGDLRPLPLLDDPLPSDEPLFARLADRVTAVHMVDLASKLCAGLIKHFFDEVNLPRGGPPQTFLYPTGWPVYYIDEYGNVHAPTDRFSLRATNYRFVWSGTRWIEEPVGGGIKSLSYRIDGGSWITKLCPDVEPPSYDWTIEITIPGDEYPHTVQYYGENRNDEVEPINSKVVIADIFPPTTQMTIGEPSDYVGLLDSYVIGDIAIRNTPIYRITPETPITVTALDTSGVERASCYIFESGRMFLNVTRYGEKVIFTFEEFEDKLQREGLPTEFFIEAIARDKISNEPPYLEWSEVRAYVKLAPFIEGVDISIDPQSATVQPGSTVDYTLSIRNRYQTPQTYDLTLLGLDPGWFTLPQTSVTIGADETTTLTLTVSLPYSSLITGDYPFTVTATLQGSPEVSDTADAQLGVFYSPEPPLVPEGKPVVAVRPELIQTMAGADVKVNVEVENKENFDDLIHVKIGTEGIPDAYQADLTWFSWTRQTVFIQKDGTITIPLTITIPEGTLIGHKFFDATAMSAIWTWRATDTARACITDDTTPPSIVVQTPQAGAALQDGVTLEATVSDPSGVQWMTFSIREPNGEQGTIIDSIFESMPATHIGDNTWQLPFDTTQLSDGYYLLLARASDMLGNEGYVTVQFSIRNWACVDLLPASTRNKAGRTIPVKFSLSIFETVDPTKPFVWNEELTIIIYAKDEPTNILQTSTYGTAARDYRIDPVAKIYITNFQTLKTPTTYVVEIYRKGMLIGTFEFQTVK